MNGEVPDRRMTSMVGPVVCVLLGVAQTLAAMTLTAATTTAQAVPAAATTVGATGLVETSAGLPLAFADVEALNAGEDVLAATRTGAEGRFELTWPGAVAAAVRVQAEGYAPVVIDLLPPQLASSQELRAVLRRLVSLEGELVGADGTPAAGVMLELLSTAPHSRLAEPAPLRVNADASGRFRFSPVEGGQVVEIRVLVAGHILAKPLLVAVGDDAAQRVRLQLPRLCSLEVRVLGPSHALVGPDAGTLLLVPDVPMAEPHVSAFPSEGPVRFADLDASAAFDVVVSRQDHSRVLLGKVRLTGELTQVTLNLPAPAAPAPELHPSWTFTWAIVDENENPLTTEYLSRYGFLPVDHFFGALLTERSGAAENVLWLDTGGQGTEGRVATRLIPPVRLCTSAVGQHLVDGKIRPGDKVLLRTSTDPDDVAELKLEIVDESGNPATTDELLCRDFSHGRVARVLPGGDGRHAVLLERGRYSFQARLRGITAEVGPVLLDDFTSRQVRLAVHRPSAVTGRVLLESASEGELQVHGASACSLRPRRAALGAEGQFLLTGVPPGDQRLTLLCRAAGESAWSVRDLGEVSVGEGVVQTVELTATASPERLLKLGFQQPGLLTLLHIASGLRCVIERESPGETSLLVAPGDYRYHFFFISDGKLASEAAESGKHRVATDDETVPLYLGGC